MRRTAVATVLLCCCFGIAACGSQRDQPPKLDVTASTGNPFPYVSPSRDVTFSYPDTWALQQRDPPGVATVSTGGASATIWAYRAVSVVTDPAGATQALQRYLASLAERDPGFQVTKRGVRLVFDKPAFEVQGTTEINGRSTEVRSVHAFNGAGEYVLDMLADPDKFDEINQTVFGPLLASWKFNGDPPATSPSTPGAASTTTTPGG